VHLWLFIIKNASSFFVYANSAQVCICAYFGLPKFVAVFVRVVMRLPENQDKKPEEISFDKYPLSLGTTLELCGGLLDKPSLTPKEVAVEEIYEELGFRVKPENLAFIQELT
jgi:8-oxo-dGTP pyrophosphatase MutT (NUDIX family)